MSSQLIIAAVLAVAIYIVIHVFTAKFIRKTLEEMKEDEGFCECKFCMNSIEDEDELGV